MIYMQNNNVSRPAFLSCLAGSLFQQFHSALLPMRLSAHLSALISMRLSTRLSALISMRLSVRLLLILAVLACHLKHELVRRARCASRISCVGCLERVVSLGGHLPYQQN